MKRKREVDILLSALKSVGITADKAAEKAIISGLKQIRNEKYNDRQKRQNNKSKRKSTSNEYNSALSD